jgi:hypothetical protein
MSNSLPVSETIKYGVAALNFQTCYYYFTHFCTNLLPVTDHPN